MIELMNKSITLRALFIVLAVVVVVFLFDYINHLLIPEGALPYFYDWGTFINHGMLEGTATGAA